MDRVGQSAMIYDFFMYCGKQSAGAKKWTAEESVLKLVEQLPKTQNYQLFLDNWFSAFPLLINLHSMGILVTETVRSNTIAGCPLMADKDFKSSDGGSFDYCIDLNSLLHVLKWFDNKSVIVALTFSSVAATGIKQWIRWNTSLTWLSGEKKPWQSMFNTYICQMWEMPNALMLPKG